MKWWKQIWATIKALLSGEADVPDPLKPDVPDAQGNVALTALAGRYVSGDKGDKGPEIANANIGRGLNLRLYSNGGNLPVPCPKGRGNWVPLDRAVIPSGTYGWKDAAGGGLRVWGKDFTSTRTGQRYRYEGVHVGRSESNPVRPYAEHTIPQGDVCGALILNWAAVEGGQ